MSRLLVAPLPSMSGIWSWLKSMKLVVPAPMRLPEQQEKPRGIHGACGEGLVGER